jgi:hypothetical protein
VRAAATALGGNGEEILACIHLFANDRRAATAPKANF